MNTQTRNLMASSSLDRFALGPLPQFSLKPSEPDFNFISLEGLMQSTTDPPKNHKDIFPQQKGLKE